MSRDRILFVLIILLIGVSLYKDISPKETKKQVQISPIFPQIKIEKIWGEPATDMFPDITKPVYVSAASASAWLKDTDEVFLINSSTNTYIYPQSILSFHHIVNDTIDSVPVAITYCLLSDSDIVFDRRLNGKTVDLGVLGPLYMGNLVMYDKKTKSNFLQLTGQGFSGNFKNVVLKPYGTIKRTIWKDVKNLKKLKVLSPEREITFYTEFYGKRKNASVGIGSLAAKDVVLDTRLNPLEKGTGYIINGKSYFHPVSSRHKKTNNNKKTDYAIRSYWYVWSSIFPDTVID